MFVRTLALAVLGVASEPILHEYVSPRVQSAGDILSPSTLLGPESRDPAEGEPILEAAAPHVFRPDIHTGRDGLLSYYEPFDPAIFPFKRGEVLDTVGADGALAVGDSTLHPVVVQPHLETGEVFRASLLVQFLSGIPVPIPSVAADQTVIDLSVDPPLDVEVLRDGADNYFLRARESGRHRVGMVLMVPNSYFSPRVFPNLTPEDVPASLRPQLPHDLAEAASTVLGRFDIDRRESIERSLGQLVSVFRGFEAGPLEAPTGDVYLDLALGGRGVCRHRAYAFVVTAQGLGLPARYVSNEGHAFAEVALPRSGWARIDLGGDAVRMEVSNATQKRQHDSGPDPFPQPHYFAENYSRLRGHVDGRPLDSAAPRPARLDERWLPQGDTLSGGANDARAMITRLRYDTSGVRGEPIVIEGHVGGERPRVAAYLSPDGQQRGLALGETVADESGHFRMSATIPRDAPVGSYQLVLGGVPQFRTAVDAGGR